MEITACRIFNRPELAYPILTNRDTFNPGANIFDISPHAPVAPQRSYLP
jgi:hypothetical protein